MSNCRRSRKVSKVRRDAPYFCWVTHHLHHPVPKVKTDTASLCTPSNTEESRQRYHTVGQFGPVEGTTIRLFPTDAAADWLPQRSTHREQWNPVMLTIFGSHREIPVLLSPQTSPIRRQLGNILHSLASPHAGRRNEAQNFEAMGLLAIQKFSICAFTISGDSGG
jgi:hypothetical protein